MEEIWLSVIIPVYNPRPESFRCCLQSLRFLKVPTEILLVDDGSEEETAQICRGFADGRIRYIRQENQGVSVARNRGIAEASGTYLFFLDADDEIPPEFCSFLNRRYDEICEDWVLFNHYIRRPGSAEMKKMSLFDSESSPGPEQIRNLIYPKNRLCECWGKLMKRVFLAEHAIAMPPDVVQGEDAIFNKRIAAAAGTVKAFPCCSYTYNYVLQNAGRLARDPGRYLKGFVTGYREDMIYIEASAERDQWAELKKTVCVNFIIRTGSDCIKLCRNRQLTATNTRLVSQCLLDTEIFAQIRMNDMTDIKGKVYYLLLKHNLWAGFKILSLFKQKE